ncbi:hypothetical protein EQZ23_07030 [Sphingomonas sp. UV9]|uniref:TIR domain-containing protein n=1 Tax=Sphingomonas sp. UV9 TaxID=1851410 RepID=UPI000FFB1974|nr:TIR domain-containing protein [Sphingomonas sp. UV9]RXD04885.1 hypothetical protein EQZ23_07030 [Sphingomonas sp. UV9]
MANKRVFISFDYDHDSFLKEAIVGQSRLPDSPFELADWSVKTHIDGDWKAKVTSRIRSVDLVVVICGLHTNTAIGVSAELKIAQAEGKPYFLLGGYKDKANIRPTAASATDKMYDWTWPNLKLLIAGGR